MSKFIMMAGIPASGKSSFAELLAKKEQAEILSSDKIREEICGNVRDQSKNTDVFKILHKRVKENLKEGKNTIYDATNTSSKRRRAFIKELKNIACKKECYVMTTPYETCVKNNEIREHKVPEDVIKRMYMNWTTPYWFEGWDDIILISTETPRIHAENYADEFITFDQENPHHLLSLGNHMLMAEKLAETDDATLKMAIKLHDIGKPYTKTFTNKKGEVTEIAHYYSHHHCGSYDSLNFLYSDDIHPLDISILIGLHMEPYFWKYDKTRNKYKKLWGEDLYNKVMELHECDVLAH